jgi:hypothetical protein
VGYTWASNYFKRVFAVSAMPNFHFTKEQARSLTYYMLSLTNADMGPYYSSVRLIPSPEYGRELFVEKNCITCHNVGGVGAKTGLDLLGVTTRHSLEWLDEQLVNPQLVYPGSSMPEYDLETNARKALLAFMTTATPADAQAILSGRKTELRPEDVAIEAGSRRLRASDASAATVRNCKEACPTPTLRAERYLPSCTSPATTPRTKSSPSSATERRLLWIIRPAQLPRSTCLRGNMY